MKALCTHFGSCGGCTHQDVPDADYRVLKRQVVMDALSRHGVEADVEDVVEVPPGTRRRANFRKSSKLWQSDSRMTDPQG